MAVVVVEQVADLHLTMMVLMVVQEEAVAPVVAAQVVAGLETLQLLPHRKEIAVAQVWVMFRHIEAVVAVEQIALVFLVLHQEMVVLEKQHQFQAHR